MTRIAQPVTWVLVADGEKARFFMNLGPGRGLVDAPVEDQVHENPPSHEQGTERPGRVHDRLGAHSHAMENPVDWHRFEKAKFAQEMAALLDRAADAGEFERLILIAPPKTLGDLRGALGKAADKVIGELDKDLTAFKANEVADRLGGMLAI